MQIFCIENALIFLTCKEYLEQAAEWIKEGKIKIEDKELTCELTDEHKHTILKNYSASPHFTVEQKVHLKFKAFENDKSDDGKQVQKICLLNVPDPKLKE